MLKSLIPWSSSIYQAEKPIFKSTDLRKDLGTGYRLPSTLCFLPNASPGVILKDVPIPHLPTTPPNLGLQLWITVLNGSYYKNQLIQMVVNMVDILVTWKWTENPFIYYNNLLRILGHRIQHFSEKLGWGKAYQTGLCRVRIFPK